MMGTALRAVADVRELEIDGEITLFHAATQTALVLNRTASDVWRLIDGERSVDTIAVLLSQVYDADAEAVRSDVDAALDQLDRHELLVRDP